MWGMIELLVDSEEFKKALEQDIQRAQTRIYIQTLSLEADYAGYFLRDLLFSSQVRDKRILVDNYTKIIINDTHLIFPYNLWNNKLVKEAIGTYKLIKELKRNGIEIKFSAPLGFVFKNIAARNHKKIIIIDDDISYIGGINFSEHNFKWHDIMIRFDSKEITEFLKNDFLLSWNNKRAISFKKFKNITFYSLDGYNNRKIFSLIIKKLETVKKRITIFSPYITFPFLDILKKLADNGIDVIIISPDKNNKFFMKKYLLNEIIGTKIKLHLYKKGMSHLKAILIDDDKVLVGSSNYDYLGYNIHPEILALIEDKDFIKDFKDRVLNSDLEESVLFTGGKERAKYNYWKYFLKFIEKAIVYLKFH